MEELTVIDMGYMLPNESLKRNMIFGKEIDSVAISCGCVSASFKFNSKVLNISWKMPDTFPFQIDEEMILKSQTIKVIHTDKTESKVKVVAYLLNPNKW